MFSRTGGADFPDKLKVLVSGPPKSGKTSLLGTVPNIIVLDTEPHANNLQSIAHLNVPYKSITSSDELFQAAMVLRTRPCALRRPRVWGCRPSTPSPSTPWTPCRGC